MSEQKIDVPKTRPDRVIFLDIRNMTDDEAVKTLMDWMDGKSPALAEEPLVPERSLSMEPDSD